MPDAFHFNRRGKRTTATHYVGNLEFKSSTKELKDELGLVYKKNNVEGVVIPFKDGRSCGYGFVTLSWANGSTIDPANIWKKNSGLLDVNSRPIYLRELDGKDTSIERAQKIEAIERRQSELLTEIARREAAGEE